MLSNKNRVPKREKRGLPVMALVAILPAISPGESLPDGNSSDEKIDEIVVEARMGRYSATKSDVPIVETSRSVSIENQRRILDRGALNLADTYLYAPGVFGETYGFATRGDWVKVRGLDVPEYRDSLQGLFSNYNNTRPDIYTIEQVEILKGPASVLYGRGSPGGIVNIVSKIPQAERRSELVVEYGNFNRRQLGADFTGAIDDDGRWLYRVIGLYRDSNTQVNFVDEDAVVIAPSVTWRPNDASQVTALATYQKTDSDTGAQFVPISGTLLPAPNGEFFDQDVYLGEPAFNRYNTETRSLSLLADHQINQVWSVEATARITDGKADYHQAWPAFIGGTRFVFNSGGTLYRDGMVPRTFYVSDATSKQYAIDVRARAAFSHGRTGHDVLVGAQYQDVTTDNDTSYNYAFGYDFSPDPANWDDGYWINVFNPVYGDVPALSELLPVNDAPEAATTDKGFYVSDQISFENWRFTIGLRADDADTNTGMETQEDRAISTSAGLLYMFDNGLSPYASFAESFDPVVGVDNITGAALQPREGRQYEAGFKYQHPQSGSRFTLAWFDIEQSNLPNPNSLPSAPSQQEGRAHVDGYEFAGFMAMSEFLLEGNASYLETRGPAGFRLASVPDLQVSAWLSWRPRSAGLQGFKAGIGVRYVGASWDGTDSLKTPSYTLGDLMIGYVTESWDFALNLRNLSDEKYLATCLARGDCFPGERRTLVGRASYRF